MELGTETEQKILEAAEKVFYQKGKSGTSMQDIADEAGITRTSLNYYYRSKDKLFDEVFRRALSLFIPKVAAIMNSGSVFSEYMQEMVEVIIDTMVENPQIPVFVLQELTTNPGRMPEMMTELGIHNLVAREQISRDENFRNLGIDPRQLILNLISLCIFPFAARPMVLSVMYGGDEQAYLEGMKQRKILIPEMIEKMIRHYQS